MASDATSLRERVQLLPAELRDDIRGLAFTIAPETVTIDPTYKPPSILQVSSGMRKKLAEIYYQNSTFVCVDSNTLGQWLSSLADTQQHMIKEVRLDTKSFKYPPRTCINSGSVWVWRNGERCDMQDHKRVLAMYDVKLARGILKVPLRFDDDGENIWTSVPDIMLEILNAKNENEKGWGVV